MNDIFMNDISYKEASFRMSLQSYTLFIKQKTFGNNLTRKKANKWHFCLSSPSVAHQKGVYRHPIRHTPLICFAALYQAKFIPRATL